MDLRGRQGWGRCSSPEIDKTSTTRVEKEEDRSPKKHGASNKKAAKLGNCDPLVADPL